MVSGDPANTHCRRCTASWHSLWRGWTARWWLAMVSRMVRSRAGAEVIAEAEGESEEESGRGLLQCNHTRRNKAVPMWDGGDWWCTITIASPCAVSCAHAGDWCELSKRPLRLTSGPGSILYFQSFSIIQTLKFKLVPFLMSKIGQILQVDGLTHREELYFLDQLQNLIGLQVINFGTNSNLHVPWILKGYKTFYKNLINSLKFHLYMIYMDMNLYWLSCIPILEVPLQVGIGT
jgi:hypothetical protein